MRLELEFCVKIVAGYTFLYTALGTEGGRRIQQWRHGGLTYTPPLGGVSFVETSRQQLFLQAVA